MKDADGAEAGTVEGGVVEERVEQAHALKIHPREYFPSNPLYVQ